MQRAHRQLLLLALAPLLSGGAADVSRSRAAMAASGLLSVDGTEPRPPLSLAAGAQLSYVDKPLVWRYEDGSYEPVIERQLALDLALTVGLVRFVDVGVVLPLWLAQTAPSAGLGELGGGGLGDVRVMPRLELADEATFGYGSAFILEAALPTGASGRFRGEQGVTLRPRIVASLRRGRVQLRGGAGYTWRENATVADVELGDELDLSAGAELELPEAPWTASALFELTAAARAAAPFDEAGAAVEVLLGARARFGGGLLVTAGAGAGLTGGVGAPAFRLLLGVAYAPAVRDIDRDGFADAEDQCPYEPEDRDGSADEDGCPDWDNDKDGVPDDADDCPNEPEEINSYLDDDGCPDAHELDTDKDGIADGEDGCPREAEDADGVGDDDGCPDPDDDQDGVPDAADKCPTEKETINGVDDWDGCPDKGEGDTEVTREKIEIRQTVLFESGKAIIKPESFPLLDQVALQILAHPKIAKVRIEGHTDSYGAEEDNLYLSQDRADAVRRYLAKRGVAKAMLEAVGHGETRPIDTNDTAAGRAKNRRVEFVIESR